MNDFLSQTGMQYYSKKKEESNPKGGHCMYYGKDGRWHDYKETPWQYKERKRGNREQSGKGASGGESAFFWFVAALIAAKFFF